MSKKAKKATAKSTVKAVSTVSIEEFNELLATVNDLKMQLVQRDEKIQDQQRAIDTLTSQKSSGSTGFRNNKNFLKVFRMLLEELDDSGQIEFGSHLMKYGFSPTQAAKYYNDMASDVLQVKSIGYWFGTCGVVPSAMPKIRGEKNRRIQFTITDLAGISEIVAHQVQSNEQWRKPNLKNCQVSKIQSDFLWNDDELYTVKSVDRIVVNDDGSKSIETSEIETTIDWIEFKAKLRDYAELHGILANFDAHTSIQKELEKNGLK